MNFKKLIYIVLSSIIVILLLYISDQIMLFNYNLKIIIKLVLFAVFPILYIIFTKNNFILTSIRNKRTSKNVHLSTILGIIIFLFIIISYFFVIKLIDIETLKTDFVMKYKINENNIFLYGLYLVLINSLLEEFFFRGYIFLNLKSMGLNKFSYIISSLLFAVYHLANFQNWFKLSLFIIVFTGLFIGGTIFNYLDDKQNTFLNSWFVHICADSAIVLIGLKIFL